MMSFFFKSSGFANANASERRDAFPSPILHSWNRRRISSSSGMMRFLVNDFRLRGAVCKWK